MSLLLDTDLLIEYLRGRPAAIEYLESLASAHLAVSAITVAELYAGVRDETEEAALESFLEAFDVIPLSHALARRGGLHRRNHGPSHGVGLADALIAATAEAGEARLVTFNRKHFPMLQDVVVPYSRS